MPATLFKVDDRVRHPAKPEWGVGVVLSVQQSSHQGKACQRLTVRFDQAGRKTLSTAFADLRLLGGGVPCEPTRAAGGGSSSSRVRSSAGSSARALSAESRSPEQVRAQLVALPDELSDPFVPLADRLRGTLDFYRYDPNSRALLDWASMQTGLGDTLSVFSRHELENCFEIFRIGLDRRLKELLAEARRTGLDYGPYIRSAPSAARHALRRINHPC